MIREHLHPTKPFPAQLLRIAVYPKPVDPPELVPRMGETVYDRPTQAAEVFESHLGEIVEREGLNVIIVDRATLDIQMLENNISISDLVQPDDEARDLPRKLGVDTILTTKCVVTQVLSEVKKECVSARGVASHFLTGSRSKITSERTGYRRQLEANGTFRLTWVGSGEAIHSKSTSRRKEDDVMPGTFFGGDKSLADLEPSDGIVSGLLQSMAEEFFLPMVGGERIVAQVEVKASNNPSCIQGICMLRGEYWEQALELFKVAIQEQEGPKGHRAMFGAGIASEMLNRYRDALDYYRQAEAADHHDDYRAGMDRMRLKYGR